MAEQLISGSGTQYPLIINSDGSINQKSLIGAGFFFDSGSLVYSTGSLSKVVYLSGGVAGTQMGILTLTYSGGEMSTFSR